MTKPVRLLAVASGGGHWVQLLRISPAFAGCQTAYVSMFENYRAVVQPSRYYVVPDASRFNKLAFVRIAFLALRILLVERPNVIVTTGSAPMLFFVLLGRCIGARTLWIDSIANSEVMSSSGRLARKIAHRTISQWPEVAARENVQFWGSVI